MNAFDLRAFDRVTAEAQTLDNGLRVVLLPQPGAESVATAICYGVGSRDEAPDEAGLAHFLEHMMFKGSAAYGPGAIDRLTQLFGGTNNAFTSHDASLYHFQFEPGCWRHALRIEADRMNGLSLLPKEVELEREVILEEIRMVEDDPWDALEQAVARRVFGGHPYGRPVLGARESLCALDEETLDAFHRRHYRPDRAVLACAGALPADALDQIADTMNPAATREGAGEPAETGGRENLAAPLFDDEAAGRLERRLEPGEGETSRLLMTHPAPAPGDPEFVPMRLGLAILGSGRSSRLQRALVEENPLALWVAATVSGHQLGGTATLSAEAAAGVEPERLEAELRAGIDDLVRCPPGAEELDRAKRILFADWVFLHERPSERAVTAALEHALFVPGFGRDSYRALGRATASEVAAACARWLSPSRRVVGWSLPAGAP